MMLQLERHVHADRNLLKDRRGLAPAIEGERPHGRFRRLPGDKGIGFYVREHFLKINYPCSKSDDNCRNFFRPAALFGLQPHASSHVEIHRNRQLVYSKIARLEPAEIAGIPVGLTDLIQTPVQPGSK